jgi:hypothetical protein
MSYNFLALEPPLVSPSVHLPLPTRHLAARAPCTARRAAGRRSAARRATARAFPTPLTAPPPARASRHHPRAAPFCATLRRPCAAATAFRAAAVCLPRATAVRSSPPAAFPRRRPYAPTLPRAAAFHHSATLQLHRAPSAPHCVIRTPCIAITPSPLPPSAAHAQPSPCRVFVSVR